MISKTIQAAVAVGHDWVDGQYYDDAESAMEQQWTRLIWPLIEGSDFSTVLELAPGHGRNTAKLLPLSGHLYAVDINQTNIDFLDQRFAGAKNLTAFKNEGADLDKIDNATLTFVYCFDAMVHFDSDVVRSYIKEFRRVMKPGARAFMHYSAYDKNPTGTFRDHPGWRNFMNPTLFHHWLAKEGFKILRSELVNDNLLAGENPSSATENTDAVTYFELPSDAEPIPADALRVTEAAMHQLQKQLRFVEERLADMKSSRCWRLTAPLRVIFDAIRKQP